ncbi:hypothetical protein ACIQOU_00635 [Streptomyces sp. NPDC091279]|uniref:hypothetical protein n=1 Tax=Streptomyces sp. NPDC091279 TaxID=3365983 RepID=UPI0037F2C23D
MTVGAEGRLGGSAGRRQFGVWLRRLWFGVGLRRLCGFGVGHRQRAGRETYLGGRVRSGGRTAREVAAGYAVYAGVVVALLRSIVDLLKRPNCLSTPASPWPRVGSDTSITSTVPVRPAEGTFRISRSAGAAAVAGD